MTVRTIEKLDEIYTALLENRNLDLEGLKYSHSKIDSLKNEAYINALGKSEILTDKLLEKLPESQKEILKIGNIEISTSTPETERIEKRETRYLEEEMASQNQSMAISTGTVKVTATLFVEYQIK